MTTAAEQSPSAFSCARQVAQAIDTVVGADVPRVVVIGPARSGKTTLLREIARMLTDLDTGVIEYHQGIDIPTVPASEALIVDDLQLLAPERLDELAERCLNPAAALIIATRPWPRPDPTGLILRRLERDAPPVVLGVVSRADALACVKAKGRTIADDCVTHILTFTGGITWLVVRALTLHDAQGCAADPGHRELQRLLEDEIAQELSTVDERLRRLIEVVSVGGTVATMSGSLSGGAIDSLIAQGHADGLLQRNGDLVPVVRSAVLAATPAHRLAELKGEGLDPAKATTADNPQMLLQQAAEAWASGDPDLAAGIVEQAEVGGYSPELDAMTDLTAAIWAERGMPTISSDSYLARPPSRNDSRIRATIAHIGAGLPERVQTDPDAPLTPTTLGVALQLFDNGLRDSLERQPSSAALTTLVQASELYTASRTSEQITELPAIVAAVVAVGSGDLATAESVIDAALAGGQGGPRARPRLLGWRAELAIRGERPHDARDALLEAEDLVSPRATRTRLFLETVRIMLAQRFEETQTLEAAWACAGTLKKSSDVSLYWLLPLGSLVDAAARLRKQQFMTPHLAKALEMTQRMGNPPLWSSHLWWAAIQQGVLLDQPATLTPYVQALVGAAPYSNVAAAMAQAGTTWMSVLVDTVDVRAVDNAARLLGQVGMAWDGARLAADAAGRLTDDRRGAARLMACARELHPPEAVHPLATKAAQPGPASVPHVVQLSERERDVAVLLLQGKTYAEIGQTIFISPRTVEHHVASIRRRLDATSRSDLLAKLRLNFEAEEQAQQ